MSLLEIGLFVGALILAYQIGEIAKALLAIAQELSTVNTHGIHLQNYPGKAFIIKQDQPK